MWRWWPSQIKNPARAKSKISSYRKIGWKVAKCRSRAGIPPDTRYWYGISRPQGSEVGSPNSSLLK
jgi:hypothetical protein